MIKIKLYGIKPKFQNKTNIVLFVVPTIAEENLENEDDRIIFSLKLNRNKSNFFHSYTEEKMKEIIDNKMYFDITKNYKYLNNINFYYLIKNSNIWKYLCYSDIEKLCDIILSNKDIDFFEREQVISIKKHINIFYIDSNDFSFYINKKNNVYCPINNSFHLDISSFDKDISYIKILNRSINSFKYFTLIDGYEKFFNNDYQKFVNNVNVDDLLNYSLKTFKENRKKGKYNIDLSNFLIVSLYYTLKTKIESIKKEYGK